MAIAVGSCIHWCITWPFTVFVTKWIYSCIIAGVRCTITFALQKYHWNLFYGIHVLLVTLLVPVLVEYRHQDYQYIGLQRIFLNYRRRTSDQFQYLSFCRIKVCKREITYYFKTKLKLWLVNKFLLLFFAFKEKIFFSR